MMLYRNREQIPSDVFAVFPQLECIDLSTATKYVLCRPNLLVLSSEEFVKNKHVVFVCRANPTLRPRTRIRWPIDLLCSVGGF